MRFAVVGAGATGGFLGARLAAAGEDVTLVARGAHLEAMRARGIAVRGPDGELRAHPRCTDDLDAVAGADVVFLTLKAHSLPALAPRLGAALAPGAALVTAQNGIPWWYFQVAGPLQGTRLESVDPGGAIASSIQLQRVVGAVVYPATRLVEPGVVEHLEGDRLSIGEPDGRRSERCLAISGALGRAGLRAPVQARIREEIWVKLLGNASVNPVSALARSTVAQIAALPEGLSLIRELMLEIDAVGRAAGIEQRLGVERRLEGLARLGEHRTSMLQDVEAGRPLEVEALVGSVVELAGLVGVPVPALAAVYACVKLLDRGSAS